MRTKFHAMALAFAAIAMLAPAFAQALPGTAAGVAQGSANPFRGITSTGTVNGVQKTGTLDLYNFKSIGTTVYAIGTWTVDGQTIPVALPVTGGGSTAGSAVNGLMTRAPSAQATGTCDILNLDLGPLDLNVLGLQVHLDEVVLDITAQQGPGNLLGNLLCAVAGLLDNTGVGSLTDILAGILAGLLNQIIGALP